MLRLNRDLGDGLSSRRLSSITTTRVSPVRRLTTGGTGNKSYVVTEHDDRELEPHHQRDEEPPTAQQVLLNVLVTEGTERSATEQMQQRLLGTKAHQDVAAD
jgi:hypothetical protein